MQIAIQPDPQHAPLMQTSIFEDAEGNMDTAADNRVTLFIACTSIIILSLITIIGVISCFIHYSDEPVSIFSQLFDYTFNCFFLK